jgi:hypothetical protein
LAYPGQFTTVSDYVTYTRVILQDQVAPFRYVDADVVTGLNLAFTEARRIRPDMFLGVATVPFFTANDTTVVTLDPQYQMAFIYYMVAQAEMKDEEWTQDARAVQFMTKFEQILKGG